MRTAALATALALVTTTAAAQISPGELSAPHAKLEGSAHCLQCHAPSKGVARDRCLACHEPLAKRIAAGLGLHARPEYAKCETCHVEHQGRDAALVWWGQAGRAAFDHRQTGYPLRGKHAGLACEACHKQGHGYLGVATVCAGCHADPHRSQFGAADCASCHGSDAWKPARGFDHARTRYPLTGRHATVACAKCHASATDAKGTFLRFRGLAFGSCTSCHADPHRGRLRGRCSSCHTTAGWANVRRGSFDHERTDFPLKGRHATVACARCHAPGKPLALAHDRCSDCHADAHRGELARRPDGGRCESCHDVNGWRPARFGIAEHQKTAYPLAGAHLAVACDACHRRAPGRRTATYRLRAAHCNDCHRDPHRGELRRWMKDRGCESCHTVASWRSVRFDHGATRFALTGAHRRQSCGACHAKAASGGLRFAGASLTCAGCHRDPHAGQFSATEKRCDRCHDTRAWKPASGFDHNRDASYHLDGAHARVPCEGCHKPENRNGRRFVRYKPLRSDCRDCHATGGKP